MPFTLEVMGKSLASQFTMAALSLLLVFAINADVAHSHDGHDNDSSGHFDCEICLKFGQDDDFIQSRGPEPVPSPIDPLVLRAAPTPGSVEIPPARSRSPPRA